MIRVMTAERIVMTKAFEKLTLNAVCVQINDGWSMILNLSWKDYREQAFNSGWSTRYDLPWSAEWRRRFFDAVKPLCDWYVDIYSTINKTALTQTERSDVWFDIYGRLTDALPRDFFRYEYFKKQTRNWQ